MEINSLLDTIATMISLDASTTSWASSTYGKDHQVFQNVDRRNSPGQDECPFVIVFPVKKSVGHSQGRKQHAVEVDVCIYDETSNVSSNVTSYDGTRNLETFRKHVENVVAGLGVEIDGIDIEYGTIDSFPFHWAGMVFDIGEDVLIGTDPLE